MGHDYMTEYVAGVYLGGLPQEKRHAELTGDINMELTNPAAWALLGEGNTDSGIPVTEDKALMYAPVWQAVSLISSAVACLPFHHFRFLPEVSDTASERVRSTQDYLVSVSPSGGVEPDDYQTAVQFWESFVVDVLLWNNAYALVTYDGAGRPIKLTLLNPDRTGCERIDGRLWYTTEWGDGRVKALFPWEVLHVRGLSAAGCQAPSFIRYARNSIALGLAQQKFASKFFANGGRIGGILELPAGMSKPARDTVEEGFKKSYEGSDNPFRTVILRESAKFHAGQVSPNDAQMVEGTTEQVRMIARWFGLSPALLGIAGATSYNSKEQDNQAFLDHCLKRWLRKIQAECGMKLLSSHRQQSEFFAHDVSDLISMNAVQQAQADQIYIQMRVKNPNEVRARLNLLPYDGGEKYDNPNTSTAVVEDDDPPEPKSGEEKPQRDWRASRVLFNLTHTARQKAKNHRAFFQWIEGGMEPQRTEWKEIAAGEPEPEFVVAIAADFNRAVETVTADGLVAAVETITLSYERGENG